ncbi:nanos RNA binding domain protein [Onchocerca flexuosa]|uniref:Nanos RNA binding domain protein n=1 Tax=Onchocerca flexuosa TaxID=387005 RepID=A0A238BYF9_9BILA|nr:nanos RNA binding domain protein [Onchocerca flexuosa]
MRSNAFDVAWDCLAMFSLPNDRNESNEISLPKHLSEVRETGITDHDVMERWPDGWMDRHFRNKTRCIGSNFQFTSMSCQKEALNNSRRDELAILDRDISHFSTDMLTNSSFTNYAPSFCVSSEERYFEDHADNFSRNETAADIVNIWKPSVDLINDSEVSRSTIVAAPQKLKDGVPVTFTFSPSFITTEFFTDEYYHYITINPEMSGPWRTHLCKDSKGAVICPVLAAHICRHCGATGKFAHTEKYCNSEKKRQNQRMKNLI